MKYWFDTEFIEDGKTIDLISIGIVDEGDRVLYCVSNEFDIHKAKVSPWIRDNVLAHLASESKVWISRAKIRQAVLEFCSEKPEFWGYYADYDWVVLCQLFGRMIDLPKGWPGYCRDIKQWCDTLGNPKLPEQGKGEHHALVDAKWNKSAWYFLNERSGLVNSQPAILDSSEIL